MLVNCAGTTEFIPFVDLERIMCDVWQRLFQVDVVGAFHYARAARGPMVSVGGGSIGNVSSTTAQLAQGSSIPYCCSKAALDNLTVSLARTFAPRIRVNAVAPGFITDRWLENGLGDSFERVKAAFEKALPLGRMCEPDDVAAAILSPVTGSRLVTGQILAVDSGVLITGFQVRISKPTRSLADRPTHFLRLTCSMRLFPRRYLKRRESSCSRDARSGGAATQVVDWALKHNRQAHRACRIGAVLVRFQLLFARIMATIFCHPVQC